MRLWSSLSARTKRRYKSQGVSPAGYNAWQRKPIAERRKILKAHPAASGPLAAKLLRESKSTPRLPKTYTPQQLATHAATILPGGTKVIPYVTANSALMEADERRAAYTADYALWAASAADQSTRNNPWFYHSIIPAARP